jgi:hypothetical protein
MVIISFPTTATVLSTIPSGYFCAEAKEEITAKAATAMNLI